MHSKQFETYLPEFMWRKRFGGPLAISNILQHLSEQYPWVGVVFSCISNTIRISRYSCFYYTC